MRARTSRVVETVAFVLDVLARMSEHYDQRMALLRSLAVPEI